MEKNSSKKVKMQVFIISCYLFGTAFSASLFGLDFSAPKKVIRTGVSEITQAFGPNNMMQLFSPNGPVSLLRNKDNSSNSRNRDSLRSIVPIEIAGMFKPQEPPKAINKPTLERNRTTPIPIPGKNASMPVNLAEETQTTDIYDLTDSFFTLGWSDNGTEYYTTETSEYETTTDEPLNRIGGVPPGIVASILGAG